MSKVIYIECDLCRESRHRITDSIILSRETIQDTLGWKHFVLKGNIYRDVCPKCLDLYGEKTEDELYRRIDDKIADDDITSFIISTRKELKNKA